MSNQRRKALVTGAGKNLGRGIALRLAKAGHDVVIHARGDRAQAETVAKEARAMGVEALVVLGDISKRDDLKQVAETTLKGFGHIDVLVNVAALRPFKNFLEMKLDEWQALMDANVTSVVQLTQAFLPAMIERRWGRLINFAGMNSIRGYPQRTHIAASKHAVWGLTKALSREFGPHNITANCISPGPAESEHADKAFDAAILAQVKEIPLGRLGTAAEIAGTVAFLASEEAGFINGQMIAVNGGAET